MSTSTASGETYTADPMRWRALSVTLVAGFMSLLDVSIVAVALPSMQRGLGTGPAEVQWVVSGYALTFGLALVPAGRLGDALGRRRMFLLALSGFVLFSALAAAAPTAELLIAAGSRRGSPPAPWPRRTPGSSRTCSAAASAAGPSASSVPPSGSPRRSGRWPAG